MPGQRGQGQKLVAFPLDEQFLAAMDRARGTASRSAFIREAIYRLVKEHGIPLAPSAKATPDRAGKGGRTPKAASAMLNEGGEPAEAGDASAASVKYSKGKKGKDKRPKSDEKE